jgi:hypothetical protein
VEGRTEAERVDPREHISAEDPRYDGFRIREYWMLTAVAPDNQEAPVFVHRDYAARHHLPVGPALAADERRREHLRELGQEMAQKFGTPFKIRHFVADGEDEVIGG